MSLFGAAPSGYHHSSRIPPEELLALKKAEKLAKEKLQQTENLNKAQAKLDDLRRKHIEVKSWVEQEFNNSLQEAGKKREQNKDGTFGWREYSEVRDQAWKKYDEAISKASKEYEESMVKARIEYNKACEEYADVIGEQAKKSIRPVFEKKK